MKRTEKSKANSRQKSKANSRQKSKANDKQDKSRANGRQEERSQHKAKQLQDCDRDKAKHEEKHSKEQGEAQYNARQRQPASPEGSKNRCRCPARQGEVIMTSPKIDFNQTAQKQQHKVQKIVKDHLSEEDCTMTVSSAARRLHEEVQRNPDGQEDAFSISSRPKTRSRMSSTVKVGAT